MGATKIEWADEVWNPVTGCSPVSAGCEHCYAKRMAQRLRGRCGYPADDPFRVTVHPERFDEPLRWRKPRRIFVCSMGDLFHPQVPDLTIRNLLLLMAAQPHHTFCVLTKRPRRMEELLSNWEPWDPPANVWLGASIHDQPSADENVSHLLRTPAALRFVSVEPMLGPVDLSWLRPDTTGHAEWAGDALVGGVWQRSPVTRTTAVQIRPSPPGLDWVICGGETGPGARAMHPDWPRSLRDQCQAAGVKFFFKDWGTVLGPYLPYRRELDGREWNEFPEVSG